MSRDKALEGNIYDKESGVKVLSIGLKEMTQSDNDRQRRAKYLVGSDEQEELLQW